jgi:hypothetical protein
MNDEVFLDGPAQFPDYAQEYFAVFFADPAGIKLEYVYSPAQVQRARADG